MAATATPLPESVVQQFRELDRVRREQDVVVKKINKIHSKLSQTPRETAERFGEKLWIKLRGFYVEAKRLADLEESLCTSCIRELDPSQVSAISAPHGTKKKSDGPLEGGRKKRQRTVSVADGAAGGDGGPGNSLGLNSSAAGLNDGASAASADALTRVVVGEQVAARVSATEDGKDEWIVVKVLRIDREANRFDVIDEEPGEEDEGGQRKYRLSGSCIIPFHKRNEWMSASDFPPGSRVLAVFPSTTALYQATVVGQPRKRKSDDYSLEFDDDEEEGVEGVPRRTVPFNHVVALPPPNPRSYTNRQ
ncbi:unnamed protein product [Closterium sp. Yama58-4]|nr:unnamed protein product [Closterium sp. Yama58-4]